MKNKNTYLLFLFLIISQVKSFSQYANIYPTNWWVGMQWNTVQLLMHGSDDFNKDKVSINYPGIKITKKCFFENSHYAAYDISIAPTAKPGIVNIEFTSPAGKKNTVQWQLKPRRKGNGTLYAQGVTSADFMYLLIPDRFSNGDKSNDKFADMNDTACDRNNPFLRHGGDCQGIINHLDYFNDLGITAIWPTPITENNTALSDEGGTFRSSYHGYHFTDQYNMDKRFGGNDGYKKMVNAAHQKHIKIIQDAVYNHVGNKHILFLDPPANDWFNQWPTYTNTSYKNQPLIDPYASKAITKKR